MKPKLKQISNDLISLQVTSKVPLEQIKREQICPILAKQNWDYFYNNLLQKLFSETLKEYLSWRSKGRRYDIIIFELTIERLAEEIGAGIKDVLKIKEVFKKIESLVVCQQVPTNTKLIARKNILIGKGVFNIPILFVTEKEISISTEVLYLQKTEGVTIAYFCLNQFDKIDLFSNSLEARILAAWWYYHKEESEKLVLINLSFKQGLTILNFTAQDSYLSTSKNIIEAIGIPTNKVPVSEICINCYNRYICPFTVSKKKETQF